MELILLAIVALVLLGSLDRWLHPQPGSEVAATRRTPQRRSSQRHTTQRRAPQRPRAHRPVPSHRHSHAQVRPFLSLGPSVRR